MNMLSAARSKREEEERLAKETEKATACLCYGPGHVVAGALLYIVE
jgi:hypothetical protein